MHEGFNLAMFPTMEAYSSRADIKGIICKHFKKPLIQFEKCFSESDNCCCDTKWIQFPFGDSVTEGSRLTVTAKDPLIELSAAAVGKKADMRSGPPCLVVDRWWVTMADIKSNKVTLLTVDSPPSCARRTNMLRFGFKTTSL